MVYRDFKNKYNFGHNECMSLLSNSRYVKLNLFYDVKFKWNPSTKSFVSQGKVGIGNIFKNQLNRYYPCKIELVPKRSGDVVNIYLADENNNWYFFSYTINQMQAISSDEKWNTAIKELKPEKRQKEKEKGQASYIFNLGIASKAKSFLKKFEE
jgi:hypothetical protein